MNRRTLVLVLALAGLVAAVPAMAEVSELVRVPVAGRYYEPAIGGDLAYEGTLHIMWTPAAEGWNVTGMLVATASEVSTGATFALNGFSEDHVALSPGSVVELSQPVWATGLVGRVGFQGTLKLGLELPRGASVPVAAAITIAPSAEGVQHVVIPIMGEYFEPTVGSQVTYQGAIHLVWAPSAEAVADWSFSGALVAEGMSRSTGERFIYRAFCQDCLKAASGPVVEMAKPFWAVGSGLATGFQGTIRIAMALPTGSALPQVSSIELAAK